MKLNKQLISLSLLVVTLFLMPLNKVLASSNRLNIHYSDSEANRTYKVWKIDSSDSQASIDYLKGKTVSELDQLFEETYASESKGKNLAIIDGLTDGSYFGLEINQAGKKNLRTVPFIVELPYQNAFEVDIYPKQVQTGFLKIKVIGEVANDSVNDWESLAGVTFYLYAANSDQPLLFKNGELTTDPTGKAELQTDSRGEIKLALLPAGDYVLVELKTVDGYQLSRKIYFTIKAGETTEVLVKNYLIEDHDEMLGGQHFRKVNHKKPAQGLEGARFEVVTWNNKDRVFEAVHVNDQDKYVVESDESGYFEVNNLPLGKYYLIEVMAPLVQGVQYQPLEVAIPFEITRQSYTNYSILEIVNHPLKESEQDQDVPINKPTRPHDQGFLPTTGENATYYKILAYLILTLGLVVLFKQACYLRERKL